MPVIKRSLQKIASEYTAPIVVEAKPLTSFYLAEEYHQNYLEKHPDGYCHIPLELFEKAKKHKPIL
jgi:peptide methionine sulfoxide reductase msrA/msrB